MAVRDWGSSAGRRSDRSDTGEHRPRAGLGCGLSQHRWRHPRTTHRPGDAARGRRIVLDREGGDCTICHAMPLPQRQFHGTIGPPLDGVGSRYAAGELRLRLIDPKMLNPDTIMPAYHRVEGLYRVHERYLGQPILTAQQVEDVVAYLLSLRSP
jgi:L-cysteine S-thiosulfotransferase